MRVYLPVGQRTRVCSLGYGHNNQVALGKDIAPNGVIRRASNGYFFEVVREFVDRQGRTYIQRPAIDFSSPTTYVRDSDHKVFYSAHSLPPHTLDVFDREIERKP